MGKYREESAELLQLVGGKENITAVSHCMTRMRFVLTDPAKADVPGIEKMKVVKGTFTQSGQFQVIIGNLSSSHYPRFEKRVQNPGIIGGQISMWKRMEEQIIGRGGKFYDIMLTAQMLWTASSPFAMLMTTISS